MDSQWICLLKNVGDWHGSFTQLAADGSIINDVPSVTSLHSVENNTVMRQVIRRMPVDAPPMEQLLQYSSLGRGILLFESGAFSQGSLQLGPWGDFGAELGFIVGDRRLRLVQLFHDRRLKGFTLIREHRDYPQPVDPSPLSLDDLMGNWHGTAVTLYPDWRSPDTYTTQLRIHIQDHQLTQELTFAGQTLTSQATIQGNCLQFHGSQAPQLLLLPSGVTATCPAQPQFGKPFGLEAGWLVQPNHRLRMIRHYDAGGAWISLTLVSEHR